MSFNVFDVSSSGMYAQRLKMDTIASNVANINTTRNPDGSPGVYVKKEVTFKAIYDDKLSSSPAFPSGNHEARFSNQKEDVILMGGVSFDEKHLAQGVGIAEVAESKDPFKVVYDPSHPDADVDGYVTLPNINIVEEMVGMISASRAYEANAAAAQMSKSMINSALKI